MVFSSWRCLMLIVILGCGTLAAAQETGSIEGQVTKDGQGVQAVLVLINELKLTELTDENGLFVFEEVPAGTYNLILTYGDGTETRAVIVNAGALTQPVFEVDWEIGITEEVTVTAAARAAKIVDAPAAVTSIPAAEIDRQAAHGQVPKILEFTPGAEVTQSGLYDFNFNTRGFNSSLNRRVSTYIDGRDVGVVLLGAQEWAAISGGLDDVAQLDFIRGPSAALYGANASSGVINIVTKAPRDSLGNMFRVTGGTINTLSANATKREAVSTTEQDLAVDFRRAGRFGSNWFYKVTAGLRNSGDFTVSRDPDVVDRPEYSEFCVRGIGEADCLPAERPLFREQDDEIRYGSLRFDKHFLETESVLTFEAGISDIEGPAFQTGIGRVQVLDAQRPFYRVNWGSPRWNVLAHYSTREGEQKNLTKQLETNFDLITDTRRYGVEIQRNWDFVDDKVQFVIGGAYTQEDVDSTDPKTGEQTVVYEPIESDRQAVFTQVDWRANRYITLVFAGRVDWNTLHDTQYSPKAALVYRVNPKHSMRFTYNQAFQVANYSEFFLNTPIADFAIQGFVRPICESVALPEPVDCGFTDEPIPILAVGNDDLELEQTAAWEVGYTGLVANRVLITVDYYKSKNENFITDLVPQVGTILGDINGCLDRFGNPQTDPQECPINTDYLPWVGPDEAENTFLFPGLSVAQAVRNAIDNSVGGTTFGFRLAQDLDGDTVIVGRTYTNIGQVDTQGVDFGLQYFITPAWSLQASYSWFDFEIVDAERQCLSADLTPPEQRECQRRLDGILLPNSPENKASLSVSYVKKRWSAGLAGRWVEGFRWSAGVFQGDVPEYTTVDLTGGFSFTENIRLGVNVANLRDTVHHQTFGGDLLQRRILLNLTYWW